MNLPLRTFGGICVVALGIWAAVVCPVAAQQGNPEKDAFVRQEHEYIKRLQTDLRMPDFAAMVIKDLKRRYPDAAAALKVLELRGLLSQGKFDEVKGVIASQPDPQGPEAWAMRLAMADSFYAFGRNDEAFSLYEAFFKKFPKPTPEVESFYIDTAYKYPQMLLQARLDKNALVAYKRLLAVNPPKEVRRQVQADAAELTIKVAEAETNKKARSALLAEAKKMADQLLWDQDMWFGKGIVFKAHIHVLQGNASKAQSLIEEYMGPLKTIHDALVAQEEEDGVTGLVKMSPMPQCRFLLAVMLYQEAMKIADDPEGDIEKVKSLLLGARGVDGKRKPNGAYQHFINVFAKFPDSQWAMEAGENEQKIRAFIKERFGKELRPMITAEQMDRIRQKQFQEARQKFASNQFAESIPIFFDVLNRFPEADEAVVALGELARACIEVPSADGYEALLADTVTAHLAERFSASAFALVAGNEVQQLAEYFGAAGFGEKRRQTYDLFFAHFTTHPDAPQRLMSFGAKAAADGDDVGAISYYDRLIADYPASAWYGDALSQLAVIHGKRTNYTNEIATLNIYLDYLVKADKPGMAIPMARFRIAQATRQYGVGLAHTPDDDSARRRGSLNLLKAAVLYDQVGQDIAAIPARVTIDTKQAEMIREQSALQKAACLAQVNAPVEALPTTRPQAIAAYLSFTEAFPKSEHVPAALMKVGTLYTILQQAEESQEVFARLRKEFPESEESRSSVPKLAASLMELGLRGEAVAKYKEMFSGAGADTYSDYQVLTAARALVDAREYDVALQGFDKVIASATDPARQGQARFGRSQTLIGMKKYAEARAELEAFIAKNARSTQVLDAYLLLADAASAEGETERDDRRRTDLFNQAVKALKFVRDYHKDIKNMLEIDLQVGQTMIRKMNAEKAFNLDDKVGASRGRAIIALKQIIFSTDPGNAALAPYLEKAYLLSIPLELEHKEFEAAATSCEEYLATFGSSRNAPQVRTWLNQANIELTVNK